MNGLFFELLQVAIGNRKELTRQLSDDEWASLYSECEKHALLGVAFAGVERLPKEQFPPFDVAAEWVHDAQVAKERNMLLDQRCKEVCEHFENDGFDSCILKGQSNLPNYLEYLRDYRTTGDIDVLCWPKNGKHDLMNVINYVIRLNGNHSDDGKIEVLYHHLDWIYKGITVEVHFRASYMNDPLYNARFQKWWMDTCTPMICELGFPTASVSFNAVYQLVHIYRHLFNEGIGLRQLLDYYFVLRTLHIEQREHGESSNVLSNEAIMNQLKYLGIGKFASAVMYVLQTVFGMPEAYLLCPLDSKRGRFLLNEIMQAGNFGFFDKRNVIDVNEGYLKRFIRRQKRFARFLGQYPSEVIWGPYYTVKQRLWRMIHGWK